MTPFRYSKGMNNYLDYSGDEEEQEEVDQEQECYECGMMVRNHQLRSPGCTYCQPEEEPLPTCEDCGKDLHGEQERAWERCRLCHAEMEIRDEEYDPGDFTS